MLSLLISCLFLFPSLIVAHSGSIKTALTNGLGLWKPFSRVTFSFSRTRRWLPRRRWSPRLHKRGSPPPAETAVSSVQQNSLGQQSVKSNGRAYARHSSIDSSRHLVQMTVHEPAAMAGGCHMDQISPAYSSPERGDSVVIARSSATWTHRDQWVHRDSLL